jgi:RNA polymerase sigma-70 factor (ECF subfamily)
MSELETTTSDNDLAEALRVGDRSALSVIYDRYGDRVYTYALNVTRSPIQAAAVYRATPSEAMARSQGLGGRQGLRQWLLANARDLLRSERTATGTNDIGVEEPGLRDEVLDAVDDLGNRDRHLMALHLVEGLEGEELAGVMGIEESNLEGLLSRMRRQVETLLGPLLLTRLGDRGCTDLEAILEARESGYDAKTRAVINQHIGSCEICREQRALVLAPGGALADILFVQVPTGLRSSVLEDLAVAVATETVTDEATTETGPEEGPAEAVSEEGYAGAVGARQSGDGTVGEPEAAPPTAAATADDRGRLVEVAAFMAVTVVVGLIGLVIAGRFEPLEVPVQEVGTGLASPATSTTATTAVGGQASTTSTPEVTSTTGPSVSPPRIEVGSTSIDLGDGDVTGELTVVNSGGAPADLTLESSSDAVVVTPTEGIIAPGETIDFVVTLDRDVALEGEIAATIEVGWPQGETEVAVVATYESNPIIHNPQARPGEVQVDGGGECIATQTTISARVTDTSPLESVTVRWSDGTRARETAMDDIGDDIYQTVIGPFTAAQTADVRIVAFDDRGNAGGAVVSVNVLPCP